MSTVMLNVVKHFCLDAQMLDSMKFPLPDAATNAETREEADIAAFETTLPRQVDACDATCETTCNCECGRNVRVPLLSVALSGAEDSARATQTERCTTEAPRTMGSLLEKLRDKLKTPLSHADVHLVVYDSDAATACTKLAIAGAASLASVIDTIRSTLPCDTSGSGGMLCISSTLYADDREASSTDYVTAVQTFLRKHSCPTNAVSIAQENPRIRDIRPRLGRPYLYVHDGDCEHRIIVTDIRESAHQLPTTVQTLWRRPPRVHPCDVCTTRHARFCTLDDPLAEASPFYYCSACHAHAHSDSLTTTIPLRDPLQPINGVTPDNLSESSL